MTGRGDSGKAVRDIVIGLVILAGAAAAAWATGELTAATSRALGNGDVGTRLISLPLIAVGLLKIAQGCFGLYQSANAASHATRDEYPKHPPPSVPFRLPDTPTPTAIPPAPVVVEPSADCIASADWLVAALVVKADDWGEDFGRREIAWLLDRERNTGVDDERMTRLVDGALRDDLAGVMRSPLTRYGVRLPKEWNEHLTRVVESGAYPNFAQVLVDGVGAKRAAADE